MKKKIVKKRKAHHTTNPFTYIVSGILALLVLSLLVSGKLYSSISKTHVLGASTSIYFADNNTDGNNQQNDQPNTTNAVTPQPDHPDQPSVSPTNQENAAPIPTPSSNDSLVSCVGPDGRQFTTSFHNCQELNQEWGKSNFNFTPLGNTSRQTPPSDQTEPSVTPEVQPTEIPQGKLEVQTEGNKGELNLQTQGLQLEIKREDNGQVSIHAHQEGGQEIQLQTDALAAVNQALKDQEVEVGTTSANDLAITSHDVAAHTQLPISIDPTTHTLSITTPNGNTQSLNVLPDKAVQSLITANILSNVLSQSSTTSGTGSAQTVIGLTTVNNQPVFEVQGIKEKHLLGIFPVAFQKTVTLSATTGQIINTQESLLNTVLEALSL